MATTWDGVKTNKYIVLDLDSTLVNTFPNLEDLEKLNIYSDYTKGYELRKRVYTIDLHDVIEDPGMGIYTRMWGVYRPGWDRFRKFIFRYFAGVIVWSAGQPRYVDTIVNVLFPDPNNQPFIVYTSDHCHGDEFENIYKPLDKLITDYTKEKNIKLPHFTIQNVFAIDDRKDTFSHNVKNGVLIPAYSPDPTKESILKNDDNALLKLEKWFSKSEVALSPDVRKLNKKAIFD
jgi:hypothetical protein